MSLEDKFQRELEWTIGWKTDTTLEQAMRLMDYLIWRGAIHPRRPER